MSTYLDTYCTIDDMQLVAPFVFDYDRKRTITNWVTHSGSGTSEIFKAGSVGKFSILYENDIEQTLVSSLGDLDTDGEYYFDEDADVVYFMPSTNANPNYDITVTAGRDNKTLFNEFISRSSDFVRSYINKPIYKNNKLGVKGISQTLEGKFRAKIYKDKKEINCGTFATIEEAIQSQKQKKLNLENNA